MTSRVVNVWLENGHAHSPSPQSYMYLPGQAISIIPIHFMRGKTRNFYIDNQKVHSLIQKHIPETSKLRIK